MRIDKPTLQCDKCKTTTQDLGVMAQYHGITGMYNKYQGAKEEWDLCPNCWKLFGEWIKTP